MTELAWLYTCAAFYSLGVLHGIHDGKNLSIKRAGWYGLLAIFWPVTIFVGLISKKGGAE